MNHFQRHSQSGFGLIEVLVGFAVVAIVISLAMNLLSHSFKGQATNRQAALVRKSFGGAEMALIDQRQCRCNFFKATFPVNATASTQLIVKHLKTFVDVDNCSDQPVDDILADTTQAATQENRALEIFIATFQTIVPQILYRAQVVVATPHGQPVQFPILIHTHSDTTDPTKVDLDICGVDRAS